MTTPIASWWAQFQQGARQLHLESESKKLGVSPGTIVDWMAAQGIMFKQFQVGDYRARPIVDVPVHIDDRNGCEQRLAVAMQKVRAEMDALLTENRALRAASDQPPPVPPRDDEAESAQREMEEEAAALNIPVAPPAPAPTKLPKVVMPPPRVPLPKKDNPEQTLFDKMKARELALNPDFGLEPGNDDDDDWKAGYMIRCRICGEMK